MRCPRCKTGTLTTADGLTYCLNCAFEPPESQNRRAVPPREDNVSTPEPIAIQSAAALGRGCVERCEGLASEIEKLTRQIEMRRAEITKLAKVAELCEIPVPASVLAAMGKRVGPKSSGAAGKRGTWACPDCGYQTSNRWASRHVPLCPKAVAS